MFDYCVMMVSSWLWLLVNSSSSLLLNSMIDLFGVICGDRQWSEVANELKLVNRAVGQLIEYKKRDRERYFEEFIV